MTPILETEHLSKSFSGVRALREVDFRVQAREIHAVVGHNGAGKSTLVKILNGVYPSAEYEGRVLLDGTPVHFASPADARVRGIAYVPQEIQVLDHLSIAENIFVGQMGLGRGSVVVFRRLFRRATGLLRELEVGLDPRAPVASLGTAQRQLVMILRAIAANPSVLMLDEPTSSLSGDETESLFAVLRTLRERGVTMIYITHRIPEVIAICDRATVLRDGEVVAELERSAFREQDIVSAMVGRRLDLLFPQRETAVSDDEALRVEGLRVPSPTRSGDIIHGVTLSVRRGEIVGLAGLLGSGRTEVLSAVFGRLHCEGRILIDNRRVDVRRPSDALRAGVAMLTEDRKANGLLFNLRLRDNITIGNLGQVARHGLIDRRREARVAIELMHALSVRASSPTADVAHLSGGNQQKLLFARVLMAAPRVLLLDEPTKGIDIETRQEIYRLIVELADKGVGILLVSSEIPELLGLCDRCYVLADGTIVDEFERSEGSEERVIAATTIARRAHEFEAEAVSG